MSRNPYPIIVFPSAAARRVFGSGVEVVAGLALRTLLRERQPLEMAHRQFKFRNQHVAFSSRIGEKGDLIVEIDLGDARLASHVIPESEYRAALAGRPGRRERGG